jgi:hypothetical protein
MQISEKAFIDVAVGPMNMTCSIEPRLLEFDVTYYNNSGLITLEAQDSTDLPINTSTAVRYTMTALESHLSNTQSLGRNLIVDAIYQLHVQNGGSPQDFSSQVPELMVSLSPSEIMINIFNKTRPVTSRV